MENRPIPYLRQPNICTRNFSSRLCPVRETSEALRICGTETIKQRFQFQVRIAKHCKTGPIRHSQKARRKIFFEDSQVRYRRSRVFISLEGVHDPVIIANKTLIDSSRLPARVEWFLPFRPSAYGNF